MSDAHKNDSPFSMREDWLAAKARGRLAGFEGPEADAAEAEEEALFGSIIVTPSTGIADVLAKVRVLQYWHTMGHRADHMDCVLIESIAWIWRTTSTGRCPMTRTAVQHERS